MAFRQTQVVVQSISEYYFQVQSRSTFKVPIGTTRHPVTSRKEHVAPMSMCKYSCESEGSTSGNEGCGTKLLRKKERLPKVKNFR